MKKGYSAVFHNAWGQKNKDSHQKSIFNRPGTEKTKTLIEKSIFNKPETKKNKDSHWKINFQ